MATPTPGTFPSFPPYQPGALPYSGSEILLLVTSATATASATYYDLVTNIVGKTPSVLPNANPGSADLLTFYQASSGLPFSCEVGNLGVQAGNLPVGGGTAQLLSKINAVNFNAQWVNPSSFISAGTGIVLSGSTALVLSVTGGTFGGFGNPTGTVGLTAVNGVASTVMASDSAPALSQAITPTWTGQHIFSATAVFNSGVGIGTSVLGTNLLNVTGTGLVARLGIGTTNATNRLDVAGGVAIGSYAGTIAAQSNGLIVSGAVAIGTSNPTSSQFYVTGGTTTINQTAIFNGNVAIGTSIPGAFALNVVGTATISVPLAVPSGGLGTAALTGLAYGNGSAALSALASGTTGFVLVGTGTASVPVFAGGLRLLNTLLPSAIGSVADTTSISAAFSRYRITFDNVCPSTTASIEMLVATTGSTWLNTGYVSIAQVNVSATVVTDTSTAVILLSGSRATTQLGSTTAYGLFGFLELENPSSALYRKSINGQFTYLTPGASGTTTLAIADIGGYFDGSSNAVVSLNFTVNTGVIATGVIKIWGYV